MKFCSNCNREYDDGLNFCSQCGGALTVKHKIFFCPVCGKQLGECVGKFCPYCGCQIIETKKSLGEHIVDISRRITLSTKRTNNDNCQQNSAFENKVLASEVHNASGGKDNFASKSEENFSVKEILHRIFSFDGCIGRLEYLIVAVVTDILLICVQIVCETSIDQVLVGGSLSATGPQTAFIVFASIFLGFIKFANVTKRIHDLGKGGIWAFVGCLASRQIALEVVLILFLSIKKGIDGYNPYAS